MVKKVKVIPTIFSKDLNEFNKRLFHLSFTKDLHVDIMDGKFVNSKSVSISQLPLMEKRAQVHLMVENPTGFIEPLVKLNFKKIIFHVESKCDIKATIFKIKSLGAKPVLAINPKTNISSLIEYADFCDEFLFMGVNPGKENQNLISGVLEKINKFKEKIPKSIIQLDGGINLESAKSLKKNVNIVNVGSYLNESKEPLDNYIKLMKVLN